MKLSHHRRFTANHTWHLDWRGQPLFIKANPNHHEARAEAAGRLRLQDHYPTPELRTTRRIPGWTVMVYDRWPHLGTDRGLLLDVISAADRTGDHTPLDACLTDLIDHYRRVITTTAQQIEPAATIGKLYRDRAAPAGRLHNYYAHHRPWQLTHAGRRLHTGDFAGLEIVVNERSRRLDLGALLHNLSNFFSSDAPVWAATTQGDPTDWNLGWNLDTGPIWFDYDTGGLNALAGEFAVFLMYQRLHGARLTPRYNPTAYTDHPRALQTDGICQPDVHVASNRSRLDITYRHNPSPPRRHAITQYFNELVLPVATNLGIDDVNSWLRPYLTMRVLAVYDLTRLDAADAALSLALLAEIQDPATDLEKLLTLEPTDQKAT